MAISPWTSGATLPVMTLSLVDDNGTAINLTGATLSLVIRDTATGAEVTGGGGWTMTNPTAGQVSYAWVTTDSATPAQYVLLVKAVFPSGGVLYSDPIAWQVTPS